MTEKYTKWDVKIIGQKAEYLRILDDTGFICEFDKRPDGIDNAILAVTAVNACIEVAEKLQCDPYKVAEQIVKAFDSLNEIADYDASEASGFLDVWEEAVAYTACQKIARKCMDTILSVKQEPNID